MAIPKIIHQMWMGPPVPDEVAKMMASALGMNPGFDYHRWNEERLAADGIDIHQFDRQNSRIAGVSGGIRLLLLQKYGGIWIDADVTVIKPLDSLLQYSAFCAEQGEGNLGNAVMGAEPNHPWIQWQLDHVDECIGHDCAWSTRLLTRSPLQGCTVLPKEVLYPWLWTTPEKERRIYDNTLTIHHWRGDW